jgi:hypothetical protein
LFIHTKEEIKNYKERSNFIGELMLKLEKKIEEERQLR